MVIVVASEKSTEADLLSKPTNILRKGAIFLIVVALLAASLAYFYRKGDGELPVYTTAISRMVDGAEIYRTSDNKAFTYPPFAAIPFLPFLALPPELHNALWYLVNIGVFFFIFRQLTGLVQRWLPGEENLRLRRFFWVFLLLLVARHLSSVFESKANDIIMLFLMFEAARLASQDRFSSVGIFAGIGAAFKATPWLFLPILVWQRRFMAAAVLIAAAMTAHLVPDIVFPRNDGNSWTLSWYSTFLSSVRVDTPVDAEGAWSAWNQLNQSLTATLYRLSTPFDATLVHPNNVNLWTLKDSGLSILNISAQLCVLLLLVLATQHRETTELRRFGQAGTVLCAMLLLSPMSSKSHFGVLIVPFSFCVVELVRDPRRLVIGIHLALIFVLGTLTSKGILGKDLGNLVLAYGSITWLTLLTLTGSLYLLCRPEAPSEIQHSLR